MEIMSFDPQLLPVLEGEENGLKIHLFCVNYPIVLKEQFT